MTTNSKKEQPAELRIRTTRLTLRPFREADREPLRRLLGMLDKRVLFDSGGRPVTAARLADTMIREAAPGRHLDPPRLSLAILPRGGRTVIGGALLHGDAEGGADAGLWLSPEHRERGLGKEALTALLQYGFRELGRTRISGASASSNHASIRVMESCGMRFRHSLIAEDRHGTRLELRVYAIQRCGKR